MKTKFYIFLALLTGSLVIPFADAEGQDQYSSYSTNGEDFYYITTNGQAVIEGGEGTNAVIIPGSLNGVPVGSIGPEAFSDDSYNADVITSVIITNSGISIGDWAFFLCPALTNVVLGSDVTNIGYNAFARCPNLSQVFVDPDNPAFTSTNGILFDINQQTLIRCLVNPVGAYSIPTTVTNIAPAAFSRCGQLTDLTIPPGVISIGSNAFDFCTSLTEITIPDSVTSIGAWAFAKCTSLTNVTLGAGLKSLGSDAFVLCTNLPGVNIPASVVNIGNDAFDFCTGLTNVTFGAGISSIALSTFWSCTGLLGVSIPSGVTNVGNDAFWSCSGLTNIAIGSGLTGIGTNAFYWCPSLIGINVDPANPAYSAVNGVLFNKNQTLLVQYPNGLFGDYAVPGGVQNIGSYGFSDSSFLTTVTLPGSVTNLGVSAFEDCQNLSGVYFYGKAPAADVTAFNYDTNVFAFYLPGATGWSTVYDGLSTALWSPASFGRSTNQLGFNVTGSSNLEIVIVACTNLTKPNWQPIQTNILAGGAFYFSDPQWTNYPGRFYRLRSP